MAPALRVAAQEEGSIGIRLTEAPAERRDDPRAHVYIVDHVEPGAEISRSFEVSNTTGGPVPLQLYVGAASIEGGSFVPAERETQTELTSWASVDPSSVVVESNGVASARVTIRVPEDASPGERYGVVLAEAPAQETTGSTAVAARVGIRIYLSVAEGGEPASDFTVDSLTAGRTEEGRPVVLARVENTGGRALDMRGELALSEGPGGLSAGPFEAELGTTIAPGQSAPVRVELDPALPPGPWNATMTMRSGLLEREVEAEITFPEEPGTFGDAVDADPVEQQRRVLIPLAGGAAAVVVAAIGWYLLGQRRAANLARRAAQQVGRRG